MAQYCNEDVEMEQGCCDELEAGKVRHIILVKPSYAPTLITALDAANSDPAALAAAWAAAIALGKIRIIKNVTGKYTGTDKTEKGYGDRVSVVTNTEHVLGFMMPNVILNGAWIDNQKYGNKEWYIFFATENYVWNTGATASMRKGEMPITDDEGNHIKYDIEYAWNKQFTPRPYPRTNALFSCEPYLDVTFIDRTGDDLNFTADFLMPCAGGGGSLTCTAILRGISNVTGTFTITPTSVSVSDTSANITIPLPMGYTAGSYTFTFELTGCGQSPAQTKSVTEYVA